MNTSTATMANSSALRGIRPAKNPKVLPPSIEPVGAPRHTSAGNVSFGSARFHHIPPWSEQPLFFCLDKPREPGFSRRRPFTLSRSIPPSPSTTGTCHRSRRRTCAIGDIDEPAVRMHVHVAGGLTSANVPRLTERVLHEDRGRTQALTVHAIDIELVFPLARDVDPRLGRVKVEMSWPEAVTAARRDRREIRQHAVLEAEELERRVIVRLAARGV